MTKKVLILSATKNGRSFSGLPHETSLRSGAAVLQQLLGDIQVYVAAMNELEITVIGNIVRVYDIQNATDLKDYDFVRCINVTFARDHFMAVAFYLQHHSVPFIDAADVQGTPFGKISQMVRFALQGIPVPDTIALWNSDALTAHVVPRLQFPGVFKYNHGTKGQNNFLVNSANELGGLVREHGHEGYVYQPFIPNDGDYRVLYIGNERLVFYRQARAGSHLNNSSQDGQGTLLAETDCDPTVLEAASKAMQAYGREIGGVDVLLRSGTNELYILEVNDTPAIFGGVFPDQKAARYAAYVRTKLEKGMV